MHFIAFTWPILIQSTINCNLERIRLQILIKREAPIILIMHSLDDMFLAESIIRWVHPFKYGWYSIGYGYKLSGNFITIQTTFIRERYDKLEMEENPDKILSGIVENCKILNSKVDNMAAILIFLKKGELKAWLIYLSFLSFLSLICVFCLLLYLLCLLLCCFLSFIILLCLLWVLLYFLCVLWLI